MDSINTGESSASINTGTAVGSIKIKTDDTEEDAAFSADRLQDVVVGEMYATLLGNPLLKWL
eukprot:3138630-Prymnesium_polylepis.1